jgi:hypothetical protein
MSLNLRDWLPSVLLLGAVACKETAPAHVPSTELGTVQSATSEATPAETPRVV